MSDERHTSTHVEIIDVSPRAVPDFVAWFDGEYMPRSVTATGWARARRFHCTEEPHLQLAIFEGSGPALSDPPAAVRSELGGRWIRTYLADTFNARGVYGSPAATPQCINAISVQVRSAAADEFDRWYDAVHVPEILECPGWLAARRFRSTTDPSRFLAVYDLVDDVTPFASEQYENAVGWDSFDEQIVGYHGFRTYALAALHEPAARRH